MIFTGFWFTAKGQLHVLVRKGGKKQRVVFSKESLIHWSKQPSSHIFNVYMLNVIHIIHCWINGKLSVDLNQSFFEHKLVSFFTSSSGFRFLIESAVRF